jgi:hypothetical protein
VAVAVAVAVAVCLACFGWLNSLSLLCLASNCYLLKGLINKYGRQWVSPDAVTSWAL